MGLNWLNHAVREHTKRHILIDNVWNNYLKKKDYRQYSEWYVHLHV
jgi:hypothetical protein